MLFAVGFLIVFLFGGITGVILASPPLDFAVSDSYFVVAHFHYVLAGTVLFAMFGGFYFWWPKMTGKMLDNRIGKLNFWLLFIGFNVTFLVQQGFQHEQGEQQGDAALADERVVGLCPAMTPRPGWPSSPPRRSTPQRIYAAIRPGKGLHLVPRPWLPGHEHIKAGFSYVQLGPGLRAFSLAGPGEHDRRDRLGHAAPPAAGSA